MKRLRIPLVLMAIVTLMSLVVVLAQAKTDTFNFNIGGSYGYKDQYAFEAKTPGTIRLVAHWTGTAQNIALMLNCNWQVNALERVDGHSPLILTHQLTQDEINRGTTYIASVAIFGGGAAAGNVQVEYPTPVILGPILGPILVTPLPQRFDRFDRLGIVSIEKTGNNAIFTVDYTLMTPHSRDVFMGAAIMQGDRESVYFGFGPARVNPGSGRATVEVSYRHNNPPATLSTDKVQVYLYEGGQRPFCRAIQDLQLNWTR